MFREHVALCFIKDPHGLKMAREIGIDNICWETDYPHSDSTWPNAPERLLEELSGTDLTDAEINKITFENAMRTYSYDPFAHIDRADATVGALRSSGDRRRRRAPVIGPDHPRAAGTRHDHGRPERGDRLTADQRPLPQPRERIGSVPSHSCAASRTSAAKPVVAGVISMSSMIGIGPPGGSK